MGTFTYDSSVIVDFEDRLLLHLQIVITAKLRRDESFMFSWSKPDEVGGRTTVWIDRHVPVSFDFTHSAMPSINRQWVEELMATTHRTSGLQILPEATQADVAREHAVVT
ncbi:DUF7882 family protein [Marisediminicola senii]|uniref:DUF7882 family protein n=1 Tax=Marisediminicola senii TaxID=2711233 RepID=UPI0013EC0A56|nr:ATP-dependent DNA ligase [Marisediminicola senii]